MNRLLRQCASALLCLAALPAAAQADAPAWQPLWLAYEQQGAPVADFLFVGSFHMDNPGLDVHNLQADDMLAPRRQAEIAEVVALLQRYRPTKVMVEFNTSRQAVLQQRYQQSCSGDRALTRDEIEQLAMRLACAAGLPSIEAVDWNDLGPFPGEALVDYRAAAEQAGQAALLQAHTELGARANTESQQVLADGTVRDMLAYLNAPQWLAANARSYQRLALFGDAEAQVGANWMQLWFGRNQRIFNNIMRRTVPGDRVLVLYGAGHGNLLRHLASDSGVYRVHDPLQWLSPAPEAAH